MAKMSSLSTPQGVLAVAELGENKNVDGYSKR
jgi:hypothetical protein